MIILGIMAGIFVFFVTGSVIGGPVLHKADAGVLPGIVAASWIIWIFWNWHQVQRYKLLHPLPKTYNVNLQEAFGEVLELLRSKAYNFGDKWHVNTAEPNDGYITADLRFSDEESSWDISGGRLSSRTRRVQRYIGIEVQFKEEGSTKTTVQLDFDLRVESLNYAVCDEIVTEIQDSIDVLLGDGVPVGKEPTNKLPAPPWALVVTTAVMPLCMAGDVLGRATSVFGDIWSNPGKLEQSKRTEDQQVQQIQNELAAWKQFKESHHLQ